MTNEPSENLCDSCRISGVCDLKELCDCETTIACVEYEARDLNNIPVKYPPFVLEYLEEQVKNDRIR